MASSSMGVPCSSDPLTKTTSSPFNLKYLATTSAERAEPIIVPRWGT